MNQRQAQEVLRERLHQLRTGTYADAGRLTLAAFLSKWLDYRKPNVSPKTYERDQEIISRHVNPRIGGMRPRQAAAAASPGVLCRGWQKNGRLDGKEGLAPKTVRNVHGLVHAALHQAVRWQLLAVNPADMLDPPRVRRSEARTVPEAGVAAISAALEGSGFRVPVLIILATGMRRGEALGLKWEDFDADRGVLIIRRSVGQIKGIVYEKEPKTGRARVVPLPAYTLQELRGERSESAAPWVCAHSDGRQMTPQSLGKGFMRLAKTAGVQGGLHSLRHTQATELIMAGIPVKTVSERLGHANTAITQDLYTHVLPHSQSQAVGVIEGWLERARNRAGVQTVPKSSEKGTD